MRIALLLTMRIVLLLMSVPLLVVAAERDGRVTTIRRGTVKVLAQRELGSRPDPGSAVMIGELDGMTYFLTACHVVQEKASLEIKTYAKLAQTVFVKVYDDRCQRRHDVAVLVAHSFMLTDSVEQIVQGDAAKLTAGDRLWIVGHSSGNEWKLRQTNVVSVTTDRIFVPPGVIQDGDSGGPMIDNYGRLVGMMLGEAPDGNGWGVQLNAALGVLDGWRVPYTTKIPVNLCDMITNVIGWSQNEFSDIKGPQVELRKAGDAWGYFEKGPEWQLLDKSMDITGEGRSRLLAYGGNTVYYLAKFGRQSDLKRGQEVQSRLANRIKACLPDKDRKNPIKTRGRCLSVWTPVKRMFFHPPASFAVYLNPKTFSVELFMYRSAPEPGDCTWKD